MKKMPYLAIQFEKVLDVIRPLFLCINKDTVFRILRLKTGVFKYSNSFRDSKPITKAVKVFYVLYS